MASRGLHGPLLRGGVVLEAFARTLARPSAVVLLDLDALLRRIDAAAGSAAGRRAWAQALLARYADL